jgi:uncharacterized protein with WD repeat
VGSKARAGRPAIPGLAPSQPASASATKPAKKASGGKSSSASSQKIAAPAPSAAEPLRQEEVHDVVEKVAGMMILRSEGDGDASHSVEKKLRNLYKKLRQITEIEEKLSKGESITAEQLDKLAKKQELEEEISRLS